MTDKIGRNDICLCGSGKKYKKCCMPVSTVTAEILDFSWCKLRQTEGSVIDKHLMPYFTQELPDEVLATALDDFLLDELPASMDKELLFHNLFIPWALFNWMPLDDFGIDQFEPEETISENYLKRYLNKLSRMESDFIVAMNKTHYSFYSVLEVAIEKSLVVKDILLGTLHTLKERQGTRQIKRGDVVFGRILSQDEQSIFVGMAPFIIDARYQNHLLDFRQWLIEENDNSRLSGTLLREEFEEDLFDYFFEIMEASFNPKLPILMNTDGEPMQFSKSYFKLDITPEAALRQLLPLTLSKNVEEFLQDAERDKSDSIKQIEFPWLKKGNKKNKSWDNTVMGHITVNQGKLTLETNSEKRIQRGRKLLEKHLGESIHFQKTLIESPEQKLKSLPESEKKNRITSDLLNSSEINEKIQQMAQKHWESWFDEPIPMLNHKTPREAAKTADGRERLEALLLQYERYNLEQVNNLLKTDVHYLRAELGLD